MNRRNHHLLKTGIKLFATLFIIFVAIEFTACSNHIMDITEALPQVEESKESNNKDSEKTTENGGGTASGGGTTSGTPAEGGGGTTNGGGSSGGSNGGSNGGETPPPSTPTPGAATYNITVASGIENGSISVSKTTAAAGETISITVNPASGYELETITVRDSSGTSLTVTNNTFVMPESNVSVNASFRVTVTYYNISIESGIPHGTITVDKTTATAGETVTITATPDNGYDMAFFYLSKLPFTASSRQKIIGYSFIMPSYDVSISTQFLPATISLKEGGNFRTNTTITIGYESMTKFLHSTTPPETGTYFYNIASDECMPCYIWKEGSTLYYYAKGYTDTYPPVKKILLKNGYNFSGFWAVTEIDLEYFDTSNVTSMSSMFSGCHKLTSLNLENFDTSNVTDMSYMFYDCCDLTSLNLENFDTSNVTNMSYMFSDCYKLTSLNLENFDTSNVTNMKEMFYYNYTLQTITVSSRFVLTNVIRSNDMFYRCYELVGGSGTKWNSSHLNIEYARVDNPPDAPGYFTLKQ